MGTKTVKIRIKDSTACKELRRMARAVNFVWNYCNETAFHALRTYSDWLTDVDLCRLTAGSSCELNLSSRTIQEVCQEYALRRKKFRKRKLRWRGKKSLGWIPFKAKGIQIKDGCIVYRKKSYKLFQPERLPSEPGTGEFCEDARGRWYVCISVKVADIESTATASVGIDLGLKTLATLSSGVKVENHRYARMMERRLANAQRANKKRQVKTRHAKVRNQRMDTMQKASTIIANEHALIIVGDLKVKKMMRTWFAKSFGDVGLGMFRAMLKYKASALGHKYVEVNETNTTRTCSSCRIIPVSAPLGVKGLAIREWVCCECQAVHDRDVNAALNILRLGHESLVSKVS